MKLVVRHGTLAALACIAWLAHGNEAPLPQWTEEDFARFRAASAHPGTMPTLWPTGALPAEEPGDTMLAQAPPGMADSPEAPQPGLDLSRFLPSALWGKKDKQTPVSLSLHEVREGFLADAALQPASLRLLDPDSHLGETRRNDVEEFLANHARNARVSLHLLLTAGDETLPKGADLGALAQGQLLTSDACLAVMPVGQPQRLRIFLSQSVQQAVPSATLAALLDDCARDGAKASDPEDQLHRVLVRLSIQLFYLERYLPTAPQEVVAKALPASPAPIKPPPALAEITPPRSMLGPLATPWGLGCLIALAAVWIFWRLHQHRLRHSEWLLPEPGTAPQRLGGEHCGGAVWVRF